jgi:hypothetical protein
MKMAAFWIVAPYSLVEFYRHLRGDCCLHHEGKVQGVGKYIHKIFSQIIHKKRAYREPMCSWMHNIYLRHQDMKVYMICTELAQWQKCVKMVMQFRGTIKAGIFFHLLRNT